jgi:hypothetical protein
MVFLSVFNRKALLPTSSDAPRQCRVVLIWEKLGCAMFILVYEEIGFMSELSEIAHNLRLSVALVIILFIVGTVFYHTIEGWTYLESIYFITMTITTIGYGDFAPETEIGMVFTIFLALIGISVAFYLIYSIAAYREKTFDREVVNRLAIFRRMTSLRGGKKKPSYIKMLKSKIGEI